MSKKIIKKILRIIMYCAITFFAFTILLTIIYRFVNPPITPLMVLRLFDYKSEHTARLTKDWVDIEEMSPYLYNAAIASEDNLFVEHNGFDFTAIQEAQQYNEKHAGKRLRGASTISQQTAKNVFLWPQRSYLRKGLEVYFTFLIEILWSKKRIMEVYMNVIEMGQGVYGVQRASEIYFHKSAKKVSRGEAALLVACLPDPRRRRPDRPTAYLYRRQAQIINLIDKVEHLDIKK